MVNKRLCLGFTHEGKNERVVDGYWFVYYRYGGGGACWGVLWEGSGWVGMMGTWESDITEGDGFDAAGEYGNLLL